MSFEGIIVLIIIVLVFNKLTGKKDKDGGGKKKGPYKPVTDCPYCHGSYRRLCTNCGGYPGRIPGGCSQCSNSGSISCNH